MVQGISGPQKVSSPPKNISTGSEKAVWLLLIAVCLFVFFFQLGTWGLMNPGDGYFSEAAREMLERGDLVTPYLNYQIYFSKPILMYWLIAGAYQIFGVNEFAARFWSAVFAAALVLVTYWTTRCLGGRRAGLIAALALATSPLVVTFAHMALVDMVFASLIGIALCALVMTAFTHSRRWWPVLYAALALATLTKGPAACAFFAIGGLAYLLVLRPPRAWLSDKLKRLRIPEGILLFAAIAVPWHIAVGLATNWLFLKVFFLFENFGRFTGQTNHLNLNPLHYIGVLAYGYFPWVLFLPMACKQAFIDRRLAVENTERGRRLASMIFFLIWMAGLFVFFSISKTKLDTYLLPISAAFAAVMGLALDDWLNRPVSDAKTRWMTICSYGLGSAAIAAIIAALALPFLALPFFNGLALILAVCGGLCLGIAWFVQLVSYRQGDMQGALAGITAGAVAAMGFGCPMAFHVADDLREEDLRHVVMSAVNDRATLAIFDEFKPALMFYAKRPIDTFFMPDQLERHAYSEGEPRQYVIVAENRIPRLTALHGGKLRPVTRGKRWSVFETVGLKLRKLPTLEKTFSQELDLSVGQYTWGTLPFAGGEFPSRKRTNCSSE